MTSIPAWLEVPPETLVAIRPPIETRLQHVPLSELEWADFEKLVLRLVRKQQDILECTLYGTSGQAQHGLDIIAALALPEQRVDCYQVKRAVNFGPADIAAAVELFRAGKWAARARRFVLCISRSMASTQAQDAIAAQRAVLATHGIELKVWDGAAGGSICEQLKTQPELVDDFFGRGWVIAFNGPDAAVALGERLDVADYVLLRQRLGSLYATIFAQHDPGLRGHRPLTTKYEDRYVPADVVERADIEVTARDANSRADIYFSEIAHRQGTETHQLRTDDGAIGAYETRIPVLQWLASQHSGVVLGEPGFGKSVLLRYVALSVLQPNSLAGESLGGAHINRLPIWLSFARFASALAQRAHISIEDYFNDWLHQNSFADVFPLLRRALRHSQILLLVDATCSPI